MKPFTHCPICHLKLKDYREFPADRTSLWDMECPQSCTAYRCSIEQVPKIFNLRLTINNGMLLYWRTSLYSNMGQEGFEVYYKDVVRPCWIPYPDPDLSDINKLMNKIKTLLIFS